MSLIGLIVVVLILCVVVWAVRTLMAAFALPPPIQAVIMVLIVVIFVLWIVSQLGLISGGPVLRLH
jgi:hypothetical protein